MMRINIKGKGFGFLFTQELKQSFGEDIEISQQEIFENRGPVSFEGWLILQIANGTATWIITKILDYFCEKLKHNLEEVTIQGHDLKSNLSEEEKKRISAAISETIKNFYDKQ